MRARVLIAFLILGPVLAGCQFQRRPPYARDPDLLYYKPSLSSSAEVMSERSARRKPAPPPKPVTTRDSLVSATPTSITMPPGELASKKTSPYGISAPVSDSPGRINEPPLARKNVSAKPSANVATPPLLPERLPTIASPDEPAKEPRSQEPIRKLEPPPADGSVAKIKPPATLPVREPAEPEHEKPIASNAKKPEKTPPHEIVIPGPKPEPRDPKSTPPKELSISPPDDNLEPLSKQSTAPSDVAPSNGAPKTIPGNYGRDDNYTWLQGVVEKSFRGSNYALRFCDPSQEDQYGGKVRFIDDPRLNDFNHGDVVAVTGQIELETTPGDSFQYPHFRVKSIVKVGAK